MSNNNSPKPAMMDIVSAAQKSVNNGLVNTNNLQNSIKNNGFTVDKPTTVDKPSQENNINIQSPQPQVQSQVQPQIHQKPQPQVQNLNKQSDSIAKKTLINESKQTINQPINKQNSQLTVQKTVKTVKTITKKQEEILKSATENLKQTTQNVAKQPQISSDTQKNTDLNQHIVSLLCEGIRHIHNQSCDFSEKLYQRRMVKNKSLAEIQSVAYNNIRDLSNTCIDVTQNCLKNKNPLDVIQNQTKAVTEIQKFYANMFHSVSQASLDILKHHCNLDWFYNNKK